MQSPTAGPTTGQDASRPNAGTGSGNQVRIAPPPPPPVTPGGPPTQPQPQLTPDITTQLAATPAGAASLSQQLGTALGYAPSPGGSGGIVIPGLGPVTYRVGADGQVAIWDQAGNLVQNPGGGNAPFFGPAPGSQPTPAPTYNGQPLSSYPQAPAPAPLPQPGPMPGPAPAPRPGTRTTTPARQPAPARTTTPATQPSPNVVTARPPAPAPAPVPNIGGNFNTSPIPGVGNPQPSPGLNLGPNQPGYPIGNPFAIPGSTGQGTAPGPSVLDQLGGFFNDLAPAF